MEDLQSKFSNFENVDNAQVWMQTSQAINMAKQYNNKPRILLTAFLLSYFGEDIMDAEIEQDHNLIIIAQAFTRDPVNNEKIYILSRIVSSMETTRFTNVSRIRTFYGHASSRDG